MMTFSSLMIPLHSGSTTTQARCGFSLFMRISLKLLSLELKDALLSDNHTNA